MLMDKAVSRALGGLFLVETTLHTRLTLQAVGLDMEILSDSGYDSEGSLSSGPWSLNDQMVQKGRRIMDKVLKNEELTWEDFSTLEQLRTKVNNYKDSLAGYPTAMLWIQCLEMISLVREFVKAEHTGNWSMHLSSQAKMLPYFAASGHNNYTKGSYMYLQFMSKLEQNNPKAYQKFLAGYHVVRRSNHHWAGISTDLIIEQTLMRTMKNVGGITRGRSMTEEQRAVWLLSMPACSAINEAMQNFTRVKYVSSEQQKDTTPAHIKKDMEDTTKLLEFIYIHDPFTK